MLGKLIRHEFRATAAPMLLLALALIGVSGMTRLCMLLAEIWDFFALFASITMTVYVLGILAAYVFVFVLIVRRFYSNIYGAEGYLTLMLPVKRWKLLFAKLYASIVWMLVLAAATLVSVLILASYPELYRQIGEGFAYFGEMLDYFSRYLGTPAWAMVLEVVLAIIFSGIQSVLMLYAAMSIGQLFRKHRFFGSVLGYLMIYAGIQIVMAAWTLLAGFTLDGVFTTMNPFGGALTGIGTFQLQVVVVTYLVLVALITLACWVITHRVMKHAVNLQ